jgi:hypothetical protein
MDRMFIDPESGEMHDERWFRMQNIDLDTVIEAVEMDGNLGFVIIPENISRMRVRDSTVIGLIAHFTEAMLLRMDETDDEDEREQLREAGQTVCAAMMHHLSDAEREDNNENLH